MTAEQTGTVKQTWKESIESKTGWEIEQCWIDEYGFEIFDEYVTITDYDKFGNPIKGFIGLTGDYDKY